MSKPILWYHQRRAYSTALSVLTCAHLERIGNRLLEQYQILRVTPLLHFSFRTTI